MKVAVIGACGKLGSLIVEELQKNNFNVLKIDSTLNNYLQSSSQVIAVIDASHPSASLNCAKYCSQQNIPLLIACTGHTKEQKSQIHNECKNIAYCICPNLSIGMLFVMQTLMYLPLLSHEQIQIIETHHINKKDKPSGTALALKQKIEKCGKKVTKITSIRNGSEIGTHTVSITLPHEEITITHKALNRNIFAIGAKEAIKKLLVLPPGEYTLLKLLGDCHET